MSGFWNLIFSKQFLVAFFTIVVMLLRLVFPNFVLNVEELVSLVILAVVYVLSLSIDPGPIWSTWKDWVKNLFANRKFVGYIVGMAILISSGFGFELPSFIPAETIIAIIVTLASLITGAGLQNLKLPR